MSPYIDMGWIGLSLTVKQCTLINHTNHKCHLFITSRLLDTLCPARVASPYGWLSELLDHRRDASREGMDDHGWPSAQ